MNNLVEHAVKYRVTTAVGVLFLLLFGGLSFTRIPIQLTPTVERPEITVMTVWPGAAPAEVERQIAQFQEEQLKSIEGLERMDSVSGRGQCMVTLTFEVGTDINRALLDVSNRLQQVQRYPVDALKPVVRAASSDQSAVAWFALMKTETNPYPGEVFTLRDMLEDLVLPEFERVPGVSQARILGGQRHEMHFVVNPVELATRKITIGQLAAALDRENSNVSGGDFDEGKSRYVVRTVGEYASEQEVDDVVVAIRDGVPVFARDVGYARLGLEKRVAQAYMGPHEIVAMNVSKAPDANLLEVVEGVKAAAAGLNRNLLEARGLRLVVFFDGTDYLNSAITLVRQSLMVGAVLAGLVLLLFLRSVSSTLVIVIAMPVSIVGTFLVMELLGRTLNVISLAGMAFAVGMVVDNSIVVLENIDRHRGKGKSRVRAALDGTREVWGAVLASTLTTVAVFVPVVFVQQEAGQLFRDIAIAISAAVALSMAVAMTVIPALSSKMPERSVARESVFRGLFGLAGLARRMNSLMTGLVYWICGGTLRRLVVAVGFTLAALAGSWLLVPKVEYLPVGNSNFIFGNLMLPSNYNLAETTALRHVYAEALRPLMEATDEEARPLPGGGIRLPFFVAFGSNAFLGGSARDPMRVAELIPVYRQATAQIPGALGSFNQGSIFQQGPNVEAIDLDIAGPDFQRLREIGQMVLERIQRETPEAQARPLTSIDQGVPELRVVPHRQRAAELDVSGRELGLAVSALVDGVKVSEYQWEGKRIDLKIVGEGALEHRTHQLRQLPLATPSGRLVTLDSVASVELASGPLQIAHRERQRAATIRVTPPPNVPLQAMMEQVQEKVLAPLAREGVLTGLYRVILRGSADRLRQTWDALRFNFLLAVVITYLLMAALFQSFAYPLVILFSVPLASLGGFLGLWVMNRFTYQALDVLTMLGFFILVGTVVNNAILIVHQTLNHMRDERMASREAIREATNNRVRPIFMSVLTSVLGMMPLVLFPGAGSELYRGIGSVVVGGLLLSTAFTLVLTPALLSLFLDARAGLARLWRPAVEGPAAEPEAGD